MKLSFVIPAYNEEHYIGDCLEAIIKQKKELPYDIEIVVVDNASTDHTAAVVQKYPEVKLVHESSKGIVHARRAGLLASTGDLIANVDADTRITPGWIKKVMEEFAKNPKLVALSGPFIYYDSPRLFRFLTRAFYYFGFFFYLLNRFVFRVGSMLQGGNFIVRRDALERAGGFDINISFYGEDTDIARRMHKVGQVKWTFALPTYASGRRLASEGGFTTGLRYMVNFFWVTFFKKPWTEDYSDIRPVQGAAVYAPTNRAKEWVIAAGLIITILLGCVIILLAGYVVYLFVK
jgi:cellulose synthase/poly-beta-1,6-N-acetylglucosamine synthase-like glycosyltransferase